MTTKPPQRLPHATRLKHTSTGLRRDKDARPCRAPCRSLALLLGGGLMALLVLGACTGSPPEIMRNRSGLIVFVDRENEEVVEQLSVYVHAEDEDGEEDIDELYVIHDEAQLSWNLDRATWQERERDEIRWIGHAGLAPADGVIPRGTYRLVVVDRAGMRDEHTLEVVARDEIVTWEDHPQLVRQNDLVVPAGGRGPYRLRFLSSRGNVVGEISLPTEGASAEEIREAISENDQTYLMEYRARDEAWVIVGPYPFGLFE